MILSMEEKNEVRKRMTNRHQDDGEAADVMEVGRYGFTVDKCNFSLSDGPNPF